MKNKIRTLLIIVFLCLLLYPFLKYFTTEGFSGNEPYGQWELVLRQTYNDQYNTSPFNGNASINLNALYDLYGNITEPNYYNSKLYSEYDFSDNRLLKMNYYYKSEYKGSSGPSSATDFNTISTVWYQNDITDKQYTIFHTFGTELPNFIGLKQSTDSSYAFVDSSNNYILGLSQSYLDSRTDVSYIPYITGSLVEDIRNGFEKVELFLWNPRPNDKNTFNGNYKDITISKVDMNDSNHKHFWNKGQDMAGTSSNSDIRYSYCSDNRYSYCFGKLKCNNNDYSPIQNSDGTYKPYCDEDSSMNPVYCEGSALYNTNSPFLKSVNIGTLTYDLMGKYATSTSNPEYFNLFRGLTTPYSSDYIDPEISGNDVIVYDYANSKFVKNNICNYLNNSNLTNGTNIREECEQTRYSGIAPVNTEEELTTTQNSDVTNNAINAGDKCIYNHGDTVDSQYKDYICKQNELCVGYECGVKFGNCRPTLL